MQHSWSWPVSPASWRRSMSVVSAAFWHAAGMRAMTDLLLSDIPLTQAPDVPCMLPGS
jgi:hypothetical protein